MPSDNDDVFLDTEKMDKLLKGMKNMPVARVGIIGDKALDKREGDGLTNAEVGAVHEFGQIMGTPRRSFLRMPLTEKMQEFLDKTDLFDKDALAQVIREGSFKVWVENIGITGVNVVLGAFDTGGFGQWIPSNMARKKNHQTLVETQQLRNSITWDVK